MSHSKLTLSPEGRKGALGVMGLSVVASTI